jgi:predicted AAA+ superfamily ATPase
MFKRLIDFHLTKWMTDSWRKPLLLRGARQVGKTYAVRKLGAQFEHFVEINFELLKDAVGIYTIKLKNWLNKIICGIDRGNSRARVRARARARCIQFIPIFVPS